MNALGLIFCLHAAATIMTSYRQDHQDRGNSTAGVAGLGRSHAHARWDLVEFTGIRTAGSVSLQLAAGAFGRRETAREKETQNHRI